jgi:hypothetical protein
VWKKEARRKKGWVLYNGWCITVNIAQRKEYNTVGLDQTVTGILSLFPM